MSDNSQQTFVSRAGEKLAAALDAFGLNPAGWTCADFGANVGGFTDCLLQRGAAKVYAIDTGYGDLAWKLRNDPRVVVMERQNAMHVVLPGKVDFITIDTSWTKLEKVAPNALLNLKPEGRIITLVKPHYEADQPRLIKGKLPEESISEVLNEVKSKLKELGLEILGETESPILGEKGKNKEFLFYLKRA